MGKFFIVSPQTPLLRAYLFGQNRSNSWIFYTCDARTYSGKQQVKEWIEDHDPSYILIHLLDFDPDDCGIEQELSRLFKKHGTPAHFLLPGHMIMGDEEAAALSKELLIEEFLGRSIDDPEIISIIESFAEFDSEHTKSTDNDLVM